jgi:hypothetical protein
VRSPGHGACGARRAGAGGNWSARRQRRQPPFHVDVRCSTSWRAELDEGAAPPGVPGRRVVMADGLSGPHDRYAHVRLAGGRVRVVWGFPTHTERDVLGALNLYRGRSGECTDDRIGGGGTSPTSRPAIWSSRVAASNTSVDHAAPARVGRSSGDRSGRWLRRRAHAARTAGRSWSPAAKRARSPGSRPVQWRAVVPAFAVVDLHAG